MLEVQPLVGNALHHPKLGRGVVVDTNDSIVTIRFMRGRERRILRDRLVAERTRSHVPEDAEPTPAGLAATLGQLAGDAPFELPSGRAEVEDGPQTLTPIRTTMALPSGAMMFVDPPRVQDLMSASEWPELFKSEGTTHRLLTAGFAGVTRWHDESGSLVAMTLRVADGAPTQWVRAAEPELARLGSVGWIVADAHTFLEVDRGSGMKKSWTRAQKPKGPRAFGLIVSRKRVKACADDEDPQMMCGVFAADEGGVHDAYGLDDDGQLVTMVVYSDAYLSD